MDISLKNENDTFESHRNENGVILSHPRQSETGLLVRRVSLYEMMMMMMWYETSP
jgi:hypothetical protein